mmetsp:Transcript_9426/g.29305  ORF Transcript_9426/g.29305 Transcript_9426/m.29305 type:complete len:200 (-) Transcript_9426:609-1208(-)
MPGGGANAWSRSAPGRYATRGAPHAREARPSAARSRESCSSNASRFGVAPTIEEESASRQPGPSAGAYVSGGVRKNFMRRARPRWHASASAATAPPLISPHGPVGQEQFAFAGWPRKALSASIWTAMLIADARRSTGSRSSATNATRRVAAAPGSAAIASRTPQRPRSACVRTSVCAERARREPTECARAAWSVSPPVL